MDWTASVVSAGCSATASTDPLEFAVRELEAQAEAVEAGYLVRIHAGRVPRLPLE